MNLVDENPVGTGKGKEGGGQTIVSSRIAVSVDIASTGATN